MPPDVRVWWRGLGRRETRVLALWAVVLLLLCGWRLVSPHRHSVYPIFAGAARGWLSAQDLYRKEAEPYRYSPFVTVLLVPLGVLPDAAGGVLWRCLNAAALLLALAWWCAAALPRPLTGDQRALVLLLVLPLAVGNLHNGQSNPLVLAFLLAAVTAVARSGDRATTRGP
jgi:glycosyl transferase family 87